MKLRVTPKHIVAVYVRYVLLVNNNRIFINRLKLKNFIYTNENKL